MKTETMPERVSSLPVPIARSNVWIGVVVAGLVLGGLGLRLWAIRWGLPYVDHPDEPAILNITLRMLRSGDLNPHWFLYPSLFFYLLLAVVGSVYRVGLWTGRYAPLDQMLITTDLYTTVPGFFVAGRLLVIVLGSLTILAAYALGRRGWSALAGILAAAFVALSPFHVLHSQVLTTDVAAGFVTLLALLGALAILERGTWRTYLVAGVLAGLAASIKYNAGAIALAVAAAHMLHWRGRSLRRFGRLVGAGAAAIGGFALGTPYAVLAWPEFRDGLLSQLAHYSAGKHGDLLGAWNVAGYLDFFWNDGLRPVPSLALIGGLAVLIRRRPAIALLWLSFAVPFLLVHLMQPMHFMRNLIPLLVVCALPIGVAGAAAVEWACARRLQLRPVAALGMALLLFGASGRSALDWTTFKARTDSKVLADAFVRQLPRGGRIAVELQPVAWSGDPLVEPVEALTTHTIDWYRANGYRYLVGSSNHRRGDDEQYRALVTGATLLQLFPGDRGGQPGPRVEVLDLGENPAALTIVPRRARFGDRLRLLGYELRPGSLRAAISPLEGSDQRVVAAGESLQINLSWQVDQPLDHDYALFVHIADASGAIVARRDALMRQDEYPSSRWQPGEIVVDRADLPLPALPGGVYTVNIGVYRMDTFENLPIGELGAGAQPGENGAALLLTTIEVQ